MFLSIFHCNNRSLSSHFDKLHTKYILLKLTIFFVICKKNTRVIWELSYIFSRLNKVFAQAS